MTLEEFKRYLAKQPYSKLRRLLTESRGYYLQRGSDKPYWSKVSRMIRNEIRYRQEIRGYGLSSKE
jgi:hypothetical protein